MKYFNDMRTKFGFDDGDAIPAEAWDLRDLYIRLMNDLAEKRGCLLRAYAYDRPGIHNPCQILFHDLDKNDVEEPDAVMEIIIEDLYGAPFDSFLTIRVSVDEYRVESYLETLK